MQTAHFRHQFHLYRAKISLFLLFTLLLTVPALGQARYGEISKAGQDDKLVSYGFFLATHTNYWRLKYSDAFLDPNNTELRDIQSIVPVYTAGFSLGFLMTFRLHDQANILFTPKVGFYEFRTDVNSFSVSQPVMVKITFCAIPKPTSTRPPWSNSPYYSNTKPNASIIPACSSLEGVPTCSGQRNRRKPISRTSPLWAETSPSIWAWVLTFISNISNSPQKYAFPMAC
jgi:hypothetical protein